MSYLMALVGGEDVGYRKKEKEKRNQIDTHGV